MVGLGIATFFCIQRTSFASARRAAQRTNERPPLQLILYHSIHVLIIIGSIIAVAWLFSLGLLNCVLIRLPPNWFGDRSDKTQFP